MLEISHKETGKILQRVAADSLEGAYGAKPEGKLFSYRNVGSRGRAAEVRPATQSVGRGDEPSSSGHTQQDRTGEA
jgi:hypothetical protein